MEDIKATEKQMDILKSILNGIDATICATVPETGEILFINDSLKKQYGLDGDKTGQLCYKVFQEGMTERCDFCPYYKLEKNPDAVVEWEQLEPLINRTKRKIARLIDWPGGVKAHLEVAIDITAIKQAQTEMKHKAKMTRALNDMAILLLSQKAETFENTLTNGIDAVANILNLDRVTVWRNTMKPDGLHGTQVFRWDKNEGGITPVKEQLVNIKVSEWAPRWEKILSAGKVINSPSSMLPEATLLQSFGCVSVFMFPVFKENIFWGFVMFEDRRQERAFTDDEAVILRSTSLMIYNVLIRNDMEHETNEKNELARIIFEASPVGLAMFEDNAHIFDCNNAISNMFEIPKQYFLDHFLEFSPEYQPDGRKSAEKAVEIVKYAFGKKTATKHEWLHNNLKGELIPCEVTLTSAIYNGKQIVLGYMYDLRNVRNLENNMKQLEKEMDKIYYDPLTGIYNRRHLDENLIRIIKLLSRSKGVISLLMIDIDFFKNYNDTYGHSEGDKCLKIVAETLKNTIMRSDDFVARYGGEEFMVVLPNTDEKGVRLLAKNMLRNVRNCKIPHSNSVVAEYVTISIGVATGMAEQVNDWEDLVKSADKMLYESKRNGRNRYSFIFF